ncbi:MAG: flagellar hook-associated protein FlgK [Anaerocolumna sp.]
MPSTFFGLNIGTSGLYTYQAALNTTSHNIANTETKGYSRQIMNQQAGVALRMNSSYGMAGSGVVTTGITQARDAYYDIKYRNNNSIYGAYNAKNYYMTEVENYFNEVTVEGYTTTSNKFYDSLQSLSTNPASLTNRTAVVNYAKSLTEYFNSLSNSLTSIQEECNFEVKNQVDKVNSLAQQIAALTKQINTLEAGGTTANDLRDQREVLLDSLSEIGNVSVTEHVVGMNVGVTNYVVKFEGQTLVNTDQYNTLQVVPRTTKENVNDAEGLYDIQWSNGNNFGFKSSVSGGYLQSLLQVRDGNNGEVLTGAISKADFDKDGNRVITLSGNNLSIEKLNISTEGSIKIGNETYKYKKIDIDTTKDPYEIKLTLDTTDAVGTVGDSATVGESIGYKGIPYYMSQLNELVRTFAKEFNAVHKTGYDLNGEAGTNFFNGSVPATGENYDLDKASYYYLTASNFTVTDEFFDDPAKLALSGGKDLGVENKDILDQLMKLKDDTTMFKQGTPASFFQTMVAEVGIDSDKASDAVDSQTNILNMITNQRLSVSGVDMDEEAMNLVLFQNAYNLSAKVISIMDEIYDKLINGTAV